MAFGDQRVAQHGAQHADHGDGGKQRDEWRRLRQHMLQPLAQRQGEHMLLRIAHPSAPCGDARLVEPSLEEALMAQKYAVREAA